MINELFERELRNTSINNVSLADYIKENYVPKKFGKWIIKEDNTSYVKTIPRRWAECSCCKWSMSPGYVDRYAFCPNCGARMVEPQESEDKE